MAVIVKRRIFNILAKLTGHSSLF